MFISEEFTQYTLFLVTELLKQDIILDYLWLQAHDVIIDCSQRALLINQKVLADCYTVQNLNLNPNLNLNQNQTQISIQTQNQTQTQNQNQNLHQTQNQNLLLTADSIHLIGAAPFTHIIKQKNVQVFTATI